ncbi:MAG TPA: PilZ domain-containing protein [Albitalea sp.]|uniref:PilZ domain-containing protein n=1 Tax=Piscinibacter sp. TaxID=1903157 RepID=UPI002ED53637
MIESTNRRVHARKVLRTTATVTLPGAEPRPMRTWDLGLDGLSLVAPRPISPGTRCTVTLALPVGSDDPVEVSVAAKSVYSSLMGPEGFKVGLVFTALDAPSEAAIRAFVSP